MSAVGKHREQNKKRFCVHLILTHPISVMDSHGAGDFFTSTSREARLPEWSVVLFSLGGILRGITGETS